MALLFRLLRNKCLRTIYETTRWNPYERDSWLYETLVNSTQAIEPTHIVTCWDMGSTTFRTESFSNYKANRAAPPEELILNLI